MRVKMGNWSRDTMADRAIRSPKSFPKCSEGNLGTETRASGELQGQLPRGRGLCQPRAPDSPVLGLPSPTHTHTALPHGLGSGFQTTEHRESTGLGPGTQTHRLCPQEISRKRQGTK